MALLGKHCWSLVNNPRSLVARVLKARYFPRHHFLQASCGGGASFIWTGIWRAKEAIEKGFRWVVGDGKDIEIYSDQWLRGKPDFRVGMDHVNVHRSAKVCEFFDQSGKEWDVGKVCSSFNERDVSEILVTRIPQINRRDRLAWAHSNNDTYSVKTGYHFLQGQINRAEQIPQSQGWKKLWSLNIPRKFKIFLWRICRNNLLVCNRLRSKGVQTTILCSMCDTDVEHLLHLFFDCKFARDCWQYKGLLFDMRQVESTQEWLLSKLSSESQEILTKIAGVLWGIWFARNKKVWENQNPTPAVTMDWSSSIY